MRRPSPWGFTLALILTASVVTASAALEIGRTHV